MYLRSTYKDFYTNVTKIRAGLLSLLSKLYEDNYVILFPAGALFPPVEILEEDD
jgi:hypothetical protein